MIHGDLPKAEFLKAKMKKKPSRDLKHECHSLKSEQNGTQLQTSRHVHCVVSNGSRSEIEYKKTAGGRVPNAAMVHRDTFITPTLPLAS